MKPLILGIEATSPGAKYLRQFFKLPAKYLSEPPFDISDQIYALAMGQVAAKATVNAPFEEAVGKINPYALGDALVFVTHHPLYVAKKPSLLPEFKIHLGDFSLLCKL